MSTMPTFADLIAPTKGEEFFQTYWEKQFLHVQRSAAQLYADVLDVDALDVYFQSQQLPAAFLNVVKAGKKIDVTEWTTVESSPIGENVRVAVAEKLFALFQAGATLVINRAHRAIPALSTFCRGLKQELKMHARANIYITPPHAQGFAPHYDGHDILILQISGCKQWHLYDSPIPLPVSTQAYHGEAYAGKPPAYCCDLRPGDLLYLPRGLVHDARSTDTTSIHIALGLQPRYWFHLVEDLAAMAQADPAFRRSLPHGYSSTQDKAEFSEAFLARLQGLLAAVDVDTLLAQSAEQQVDDPRLGQTGRFRDVLQVEQLTLATIVRRRPQLAYTLVRSAQQITVKFGPSALSIPSLLASALPLLLQDQPFAVHDLQGLLTAGQKIALVRQFVQAGFLTIESLS